VVYADEILRHKLMVRYKIEGRGEDGNKLKRMNTKSKNSESKKSLLVSPKAGSA
jgi:hypothetical protein